MTELLERIDTSSPSTQQSGSFESWEEAMQDIEDLEKMEAREEDELEYLRSIPGYFNRRGVIDYAFTMYGPSYYEPDEKKADRLLEEHLENRDAERRNNWHRYQEGLIVEYQAMARRLHQDTGKAALSGCLLEP